MISVKTACCVGKCSDSSLRYLACRPKRSDVTMTLLCRSAVQAVGCSPRPIVNHITREGKPCVVKVERDEAGVRGGCRARGDCKECWKNNRGTHNFLLKKAILTN